MVRCAPDFSRWRLLGATPAQVGATALAMTAVACGAGALAGSLASVPVSFALVPWFNGLAAQGFPGGTGGFDPPFAASPGAWAASLVLSWLTCMLGSLGPSLRAARMRPVEALRSTSAGAGAASGHPVAAAAVAALALLLPVAGTWDPAVGGTGAGGALSSLMVWPGALLLVAAALWGARGVEAAIACAAAVPALAGSTMGVLAGKALRARAGRSAVATIPLVVAAGGGSLLLCMVRTFERVMRAMGVQTAFNYTDTTVLVGLVALFSLATAAAVTALGSDDQGSRPCAPWACRGRRPRACWSGRRPSWRRPPGCSPWSSPWPQRASGCSSPCASSQSRPSARRWICAPYSPWRPSWQ